MDVAGILLTRWFWATRVLTAIIAFIIIWRSAIMTADTILYTPADFLPWLVLIGMLAAIPIFIRARKAFNDLNKEKLRNGEITERLTFGMDYMAADVGIVIVSVIVAVLGPGLVCEALGIEASFAFCALIAIITTTIIGIRKVHTLEDAVDVFRDVAKMNRLEGKN